MKRLGRPLALSCLLAGAIALSASAASAFTFTDQNGNTGTNAKGYLDLDVKSPQNDAANSRLNTESGNPLQWGGATMQFGNPRGNSFNQRYNSDNLFNPYYRDGR